MESKKESEEQEEALEDIFERLDQLELEEEMLDEMERYIYIYNLILLTKSVQYNEYIVVPLSDWESTWN